MPNYMDVGVRAKHRARAERIGIYSQRVYLKTYLFPCTSINRIEYSVVFKFGSKLKNHEQDKRKNRRLASKNRKHRL